MNALLSRLPPLVRWVNFWPVWRWKTVRVWGVRMRPPTFDRWLYLWLHRLGLMGRADRRFLEQHVKPGMTVVDIGANQGLYTLLFSRCAGPGGCVHAFEPDDMLHAALEENVARDGAGNTRIHHCALGSSPGTMTLYRSLLNSGDNRLAAGSRDAGPREPVQIRVATLDEVLAGERIDFIKMDVQGWEMEVLRGMERILEDPRNTKLALYFEYWPGGLRAAGSDPLEPLTFLSVRGFKIHEIASGTLKPIRDVRKFSQGVNETAYVNLHAAR